jgi:hypothetical protein
MRCARPRGSSRSASSNLIFPFTVLVLRLTGRTARLRAENELGRLAFQIAMTVPLAFPLAGAAALHRADWFYPACMVIVGAHYLPFWFLYGMWQFAALGTAMVLAGFSRALVLPAPAVAGAWLTAGMLVVFAAVALGDAKREVTS